VALNRVFIDHSGVMAARLASIPNDGLDYEIIFAGGLYPVSTTATTVNHSAGGKLVVTTHAGAEVRFVSSLGGFFPTLAFAAQDVAVHGLTLMDIPYFGTFSQLLGSALFVGGKTANNTHVCDPTAITITDCIVHGFNGVFAWLSSNPAIYTHTRVLNCRTVDTARNSSFLLSDSNVNAYANIYIDNLVGNGINGPDSLSQDPVNGVASSSHTSGTAGWEVGGLAGNSTLTVTRNIHTSRILGSFNHDMHCFRITQLNSADVRILLRDCIWTGKFEAGHMDGNGGGPMWLGYYHSGGPTYGLLDPRPRIDIENCTFDSHILSAVASSPASLTGAAAGFAPHSDADYHFWDTRFSWTVPAAFSAITQALSVGGGNPRSFFHNTTHNANSLTQSPAGDATVTIDAQSLDNPGDIHGRVPVPI